MSKPVKLAAYCLTTTLLVAGHVARADSVSPTDSPWYSPHNHRPAVQLAERKRSLSNRNRGNNSSSSYRIDRDDADDDNLARSVVSEMYDDIELDDDFDDILDKLEDASEGQRAVFCATLLQNKVNNGGFDLYLTSDAANLIAETRDGLLTLDAESYVKILDKVLALFMKHQDNVSNLATRQLVLDEIPEERRESVLDRLDEEFYSLELEGLLKTHMEYYINKNPKQFFKN